MNEIIFLWLKHNYCFFSEYIQQLNETVQQLRSAYPSYSKAKVLVNKDIPPTLSSSAAKQDKVTLVNSYRTRFPNKHK